MSPRGVGTATHDAGTNARGGPVEPALRRGICISEFCFVRGGLSAGQADFLSEIIFAVVCPRMFQGLFAMYQSGLMGAFGRGKAGQKVNPRLSKSRPAKSRGALHFFGLWQAISLSPANH
jgi:hypothetical protein